VEWWNEQVTAWPIAVMWVPHHVAALVASLTVFLVFTEASSRDDQSRRTAGPLLVCAIGFLSVLGMSIWLAFAFAVFWGAWLLTAAVKRWYRELRLGLVISVVAGALSIPYLLDLHTANLARGNPIAIVVRPFFPIHSVLGQEAVSPWWVQVIDLAALPINYFLEFGVLAIAAYVYWRARRHADAPLSRNELALVVLAVSVTVIISLLRSSLSNNDLGWRTAMFVQFALLLWSAPVLSAWWYSRLDRFAAFDPRAKRRVSSVLGVCLILGMMPPAYDIVLMKMFSMWGDVGLPGERRYGLLEEPDLGRRYYDLREAYAWIDRNLPNSAVLQHNPNVSIDAPSGIYGQRQVVAADRYYGTLLGVPYELYHPVAAAVAPIFESQTIEIRDIVRLCDRFGVTALVTKDTDLAWQDPRSWVWQATPSFANRSVRVYLCEALPTNARHGH
jgi:hypothetical protein